MPEVSTGLGRVRVRSAGVMVGVDVCSQGKEGAKWKEQDEEEEELMEGHRWTHQRKENDEDKSDAFFKHSRQMEKFLPFFILSNLLSFFGRALLIV